MASLLRYLLYILVFLCLIPACAQKDTGKTKLRAVFWAGIEEQKAEQENVDAFMELHPDIIVSLESIPDNYLEKLVTAFAAHKPPDVLLLDSVLIPRFLEGDVLLDMTPNLARDPGFDPSVFFPEVWGFATRRDPDSGSEQVYALPKDFTPLVVYYNKTLFTEAGVPFPQDNWTWDDFHGTAQALTADTDGDGFTDRYGTLVITWPGVNIVWFWQSDGDVLSPDGSRATGYLDSEECIAAVEFFTGLVDDGLAPDPTAREALGGQAFMNGRIGMMISGHWAIPGFRAAAERESNTINLDDIGVVGLPRGKERVSVIYESGWAVARDCEHPEQAVMLARYLAGPEAQARRAGIGLAISGDRNVAQQFATDDEREQAFLNEIQYSRAPWGSRISDWSIVEDLLSEGVERVLLGYATPEESMKITAELIDAELKMF